MVSGSWVFRASSSPAGMLKGLWLKSILPVSSFSSYIGKSTIQQKPEGVLLDEAEFVAEAGADGAGEFGGFVLFAGGEEDGVAGLQAAGGADGLDAVGLQVLGDGAFGAFRVEGDVAEAAGAFGAGPFVEFVEEAAGLAAGARGRDGADDAARRGDAGEQAEA